jgi:lysophospholipase I
VTNFDDLNADPDIEGIAESFQSITQLIEAEIASGTSPSRIIIGGFSQGATMSLLIGLVYHRKFAGIVVLAGRLPIQDLVRKVGRAP